jgi:hypothetical protein
MFKKRPRELDLCKGLVFGIYVTLPLFTSSAPRSRRSSFALWVSPPPKPAPRIRTFGRMARPTEQQSSTVRRLQCRFRLPERLATSRFITMPLGRPYSHRRHRDHSVPKYLGLCGETEVTSSDHCVLHESDGRTMRHFLMPAAVVQYFGSKNCWGDKLKLHEAIAGETEWAALI